ncbi:MAG: alpha/beta fold hydrolase, partial [Parachlamydiaceae bacterium]
MIKLFNKEPPEEQPQETPPAVEILPFEPLQGFSSPHAQTVLAYLSPTGSAPPSTQQLIPIDNENSLCCEVSTPPSWQKTEKTVILVHGLGGSHLSGYMVRICRKLYESGFRIVRVNMRCSGSGNALAKKTYHGGLSSDILAVINLFKEQTPLSPMILIGFSLGGNIALKLTAELGKMGPKKLLGVIAVCPPVDLSETAAILSQPSNRLYN